MAFHYINQYKEYIESENDLIIKFLLRQQTLRLYRDFLQLIRRVDNETNKKELKEWIRNDFKANKHHISEEIIKMHLARGKLALREMETTLRMAHIK